MDIHLQNNIFTLKVYESVNSFVPEALGDLLSTPASLAEELLLKALMLLQVLLACMLMHSLGDCF